MGLNDSFKGLKAQVLLIKPFPSLNGVYSIIQQEEKRRQISTDDLKGESTAMMAKDAGKQINAQTNSGKKYYCSHCKTTGHTLERCFKANPNRPVCSHCSVPGHTVDVCYKLHVIPRVTNCIRRRNQMRAMRTKSQRMTLRNCSE